MPTRRWKYVAARPAPLHLLEEPAMNLWDVGDSRPLKVGFNAIA
jgi:hypothetical protein